jgi:hypothetical protein
MGNRHGFVLLLATGIFLSALFLAEGAPLPYSDTTGKMTKCILFTMSLDELLPPVISS